MPCLVPRPHYCKRPMTFGLRGPSEFPGCSSRVRHRNESTVEAWEDAVQGLSKDIPKKEYNRLFPSVSRFCSCTDIFVTI